MLEKNLKKALVTGIESFGIRFNGTWVYVPFDKIESKTDDDTLYLTLKSNNCEYDNYFEIDIESLKEEGKYLSSIDYSIEIK